MSSKAFAKFTKTIHRCESLVKSYERLNEIDRTEGVDIPTPKDIVRGAVVLAVAALDAYVTDVFAEKLVPYLKRHSPDETLVKLLFDAGLDTKTSLDLLPMDRPYRRIRTLVERYHRTFTTQQFDVIDKMFLCYRIKNLTENAERKSGRVSIRSSVAKLVQRRNQIAHAGDYNDHGRIVSIDEKQIGKRVEDLQKLVTNMDLILENKIP